MALIRNKKTGEVKEVQDNELGSYGVNMNPQQNVIQQPTQQPMPQAEGLTINDAIEQKPKYITGRSIEEHAKALNRAKQAGDTAAVKSITDDYNREYNYQVDTGAFDKQKEKVVTEADKKRVDSYNATMNLISNLEKHYQEAGGGETDVPIVSRIVGASKDIGGALGFNDPASIYNSEREGFVAALRSITGDTGTFSEEDARRLKMLLPGLDRKSGEAEGLFNDLRSQVAAKYGGEATPTSFKGKRKDLIDVTLGTAKNTFQDIRAGAIAKNPKLQQAIASAEEQASILEQQATDAKDRGDWENVKQLSERANLIRSDISNLSDMTSRQFSEDVNDDPISRSIGSAAEIASIAEVPSLIKGGANIVGKGVSGVKNAITGQAASQTRKQIIADATEGVAAKTIDGSKVAEHFVNWGDDAVKGNPGKEKQIIRIVDSVINNYSGKQLTPEEAFRIWLDANNGWKADGAVKTALEAKVDVAMREALRPLLEEAAPGFDQATKAMALAIRNKKIALWFAKLIGSSVAFGIGGYAVGTALGQKKAGY